MRGKANFVRCLLCVLFFAWPVQAKYGGGSGEPNDPYLIYTAEQMNAIGANYDDWDKHFKLMDDIDLSSYTGTAFNIIGTGPGNRFKGVFDGNGKKISNFSYTSTNRDYTGLFGYVSGKNEQIKDLGLIAPNIDAGAGNCVGSLVGWLGSGTITNCYAEGGSVSGKRWIGGLAGYNWGEIKDCYSTGDISGDERVGGLVGDNDGSITNCSVNGNVGGSDNVGGLVGDNSGSITNCSVTGNIVGNDDVGGLVGRNDGRVMASCSFAKVKGRDEVGGLVGLNSHNAETVDCYANGDVVGQWDVGGLVGSNSVQVSRTGEQFSGIVRNCYSATAVSGNQQIGGLIGRNEDGKVSGCFWDIETSGQTTSYGGEGKTTAGMKDPNTFIDAGWDFVGAPNGPSDTWAEPDGGGYPVLWWQLSPLPALPTYSGGTGEPDAPYLISTVDELNSIGHNPRLMAVHFKLIDDIDLTGINFFIIGNEVFPFTGVFDGNGHTISNFSYTSTDAACIGLFGYAAGAEIKDLGLIGPNVEVDGGDFHGSLVGYLEGGAITNCYVEAGSVSGIDYVGGLVGSSSGSITDCYATGDVDGNNHVGGLVGSNDSAITNCYAIGHVTGDGAVGGFMGQNSGAVTNCFSNCSVDGEDDAGGLVGKNGGSVTTSYSYASVQGRNAVGGLVGRNSRSEIIDCYTRGDVVGQWYVGGLVGSNGTGSTGPILNCYSVTAILGGHQTGGLAGSNPFAKVHHCFWDIETSGRTKSYGGEGKNTAEMQMASTFLDSGWDFLDETENGTEDIWWILEGQDYPRLYWELMTDAY